MVFLLLFTTRGVFMEIQAGFLLVGHTHEDIDVYFSHLSKTLKSRNTFVLADLMKAFIQSQELAFMPEIVQEVGDFKSFIKGYQCDGVAKLIGLGKMHLFKFYVDSLGWLIMWWKKSAVDSLWQPHNSSPIRLWNADQDGRPMLLQGSPAPVHFKHIWVDKIPLVTGNQEKVREKASKAIERRSFISVSIKKYIEYWESGRRRCETFATTFRLYWSIGFMFSRNFSSPCCRRRLSSLRASGQITIGEYY
jgi:hypothetical protein